MDEKTYKTGATQREAVKRYQAKNKNMYKTISITLPTAEAVASREILKAHNVAPVDLWRNAIERLKSTPDESPGGNGHGANVKSISQRITAER